MPNDIEIYTTDQHMLYH